MRRSLSIRCTIILVLVAAFGSQAVSNDAEALRYCRQRDTTYIAIVWPRGMHKLEYIVNSLKNYGAVHYIKTFILSDNQPFELYKYTHQDLTLIKAQKYFKGYIPVGMKGTYACAAIVFETKATLAELRSWKIGIRQHIGYGFTTIHINDTYKETLEAADLIFNDHKLHALPKNRMEKVILGAARFFKLV